MEHSWFVGYAPAEKPQIVVSVVLGNPENWHLRGQEAAKRLIDTALSSRPREKDLTGSRGSHRDKNNQW
jgi:cell division protein FtsI/penicillin-binding protein 2